MKGYKYLAWRKLIEDGEKGEYHHKKIKIKKKGDKDRERRNCKAKNEGDGLAPYSVRIWEDQLWWIQS